mmetsp:Transcript_98707/g.181025  ORF Transcript_98707/g.181025 Transcript_98707/m.181025 type:complete len:265 (+) Transcript_98707:919-1713(+)
MPRALASCHDWLPGSRAFGCLSSTCRTSPRGPRHPCSSVSCCSRRVRSCGRICCCVCCLGVRPCRQRQAIVNPGRICLPTELSTDLAQPLVACSHVEAYSVLQLAQVHGAQEWRLLLALLKMIGATHQALVVDAVLDSEDVAGLMCQDFARAPEHARALGSVHFLLFVAADSVIGTLGNIFASPAHWLIARGVVPCEGKYSHAIHEARRAEDKIPGHTVFDCVDVRHGDTNRAEHISIMFAPQQIVENIVDADLQLAFHAASGL